MNKYLEKIASRQSTFHKSMKSAVMGLGGKDNGSTRAEKLYHKAKKIKDFKDTYDEAQDTYGKVKDRLDKKKHKQKKMKSHVG